MTTRPPRPLGRSGISVPTLCFGGNIFGWTVDEPTSFTLLDTLVARGFTFIDTADVYSKWVPGHAGGESETILGKWMKSRGNRQQIILATKCGMELAPDKKGLSKKYILQAIDASLARLQTDYVDLYQAHKDDPAVPLEETMEVFDQVVKAGKARAVGASNYSGERLAAALAVSERLGIARFECLQPHYNLAERADFEKNLQSVCARHQIGVIPYFSLASGFLTGKYRSEADLAKSPRGKSAQKYLNPRGLRILAALDNVSTALRATPAQVALAWLIANPIISAPIASATSVQQLEDLVAATRLNLAPEHIAELSAASAGD
ncbi:MAG TPA: aldo/keto reductase [Phycisphaerae bacterium]|nr:aldo/keto reductase [Phycisphaerae bacterium]